MTKTIALLALTACSTMPVDDPRSRPTWHWVDSEGHLMTVGEALPVIVDEQGLSWVMDSDGYFAPPPERQWFEAAGCRGPVLVPHPHQAMTPIAVYGDQGAWFWLPEREAPFEDTSEVCLKSSKGLDGTCVDETVYRGSMIALSEFVRSTDVRNPQVWYAPPFHRVRD